MFSQVAFILSHPSHPGNIGACARAIKTMGFSQLILVNPKDYPSHQATAMASGAHDILQSAQIVPSIEDALKPFHYTIGASARHRSLTLPIVDSKTMAVEVANKLNSSPSKVAILFGTESSGLSNHELSLCDKHVYIPTDAHYGSLNLSQAVQILAYELRISLMDSSIQTSNDHQSASGEQKNGFYQHLESTLSYLGILNPDQPRKLMGRLRRLFNRADLDETEINILRGIFKAVQNNPRGRS